MPTLTVFGGHVKLDETKQVRIYIMKNVIMAIAALSIVGFASVASAAPADHAGNARVFFEKLSQYGN
jgi:hypothetical protein